MNKRQVQVNSGNFATGEGKKGNFNAYSDEGRFFIHKAVMESQGWKEQKDITFPFYAIIEDKPIDKLDANGEATGEKELRTQATSVFKKEEDMLKAFTSARRLAIKADTLVAEEALQAKVSLAVKAKSAGLTEDMVKSLESVAV